MVEAAGWLRWKPVIPGGITQRHGDSSGRRARRGPGRGPAPGEIPAPCVLSQHRTRGIVAGQANVADERASFNPLVQGSTPWRPTCENQKDPSDGTEDPGRRLWETDKLAGVMTAAAPGVQSGAEPQRTAVNGPQVQVVGLDVAEAPLDVLEVLVGGDRARGVELAGRDRGADDVQRLGRLRRRSGPAC